MNRIFFLKQLVLRLIPAKENSQRLLSVIARNEVTRQSSLSFLATVKIASIEAVERSLAKTLSVVARNEVTRQSFLSFLATVKIASIEAVERSLAKTQRLK
ncbi:MAG: hypothetical protein DRH79_01920 [Candidatus Cloacimonadota bacterium]|nr:MAG: hypothetical protein DRH79_01920 [Candidatus Cloacimonadota bacterium]